MQQRAALRLGKRELSKGWQAWLDPYLERRRHMRMLAAASGRLARPALAAALAHWRTDWQEELRAALEEGQQLLARDKATTPNPSPNPSPNLTLALAPTLAPLLAPTLAPTLAQP